MWTTQWFQCCAHVIANVIFKYWLFHTPSGSKCGQGFPCEHTGKFLDGVPICLRRAEQTITSATGDLPCKQKPSPKLTYMFEHTHLIKATQSYKNLSKPYPVFWRSHSNALSFPYATISICPCGDDSIVTWHTESMYKWKSCSCPPPAVAVQSVPTWLCCRRSVVPPTPSTLPNDFVQHSAVQPWKVLCLAKGHEIAPFLK